MPTAKATSGNLAGYSTCPGMALRLEDGGRASGLDVDQAVKDLCFIINNRTVLDVNYSSEIVCCLIALAYACDQRFGGNTVSAASMELARQTLANLNSNYSTEVMMRLAKAAALPTKCLMVKACLRMKKSSC